MNKLEWKAYIGGGEAKVNGTRVSVRIQREYRCCEGYLHTYELCLVYSGIIYARKGGFKTVKMAEEKAEKFVRLNMIEIYNRLKEDLESIETL